MGHSPVDYEPPVSAMDALPQMESWGRPPLSQFRPRDRGQNRRWGRSLGQMAVGGAVVLGLGMGLGVWRPGESVWTGLKHLVIPVVGEPTVDVRTGVVHQLQGASDLTTAIFAMAAIVPAQSDRTLAGHVIGSTKLLYLAYGEVRAGLDLSQITVADVQIEGQSAIRVILPPPQILDSKLDLAKSTVYDYNRGWLGPDNAPQLQHLAQRDALAKIEAAACTTGLLAEANRRAEITVGEILSSAGFQSVTVTTQPPSPSACADLANSDRVVPGQE